VARCAKVSPRAVEDRLLGRLRESETKEGRMQVCLHAEPQTGQIMFACKHFSSIPKSPTTPELLLYLPGCTGFAISEMHLSEDFELFLRKSPPSMYLKLSTEFRNNTVISTLFTGNEPRR
jgi:hypothetical protein